MEPEFEMTVNNQAEQDYFINSLKDTDVVLEFGSGASTNFIAKHVKKVFSIENNHDWFVKVSSRIMPNVHLEYVEQNADPAPGHDGTKEEFHDYIQKAIQLADRYGKFDVIFIDGRARVACAEICQLIGHKDTKVFIHDYNHPNPQYTRTEYFPAEEFLERVGGEFTMWQFKIKALQELSAGDVISENNAPEEDNKISREGITKRSHIKEEDITPSVKTTAKKIAKLLIPDGKEKKENKPKKQVQSKPKNTKK